MKLRQRVEHDDKVISPEERLKLTIMVLKLLEHWQLDTRTQLSLLGMKSSSRAILSKYRNSERAIPDDVDKLDRIALLLLIHKCLRHLYPESPELVYQWITLKNKKLNDERPLDLMLKHGLMGLAKVARYLEFQMVR